ALDPEAGAHAAPDRHRRRETDAVDPVVDREVVAAVAEDLEPELRQQRQGQEAVSDRRPVRPGRRALAVRVDPLRVLGRGGETIDALLIHLNPTRRAELQAALHSRTYRPGAGSPSGRAGGAAAPPPAGTP